MKKILVFCKLSLQCTAVLAVFFASAKAVYSKGLPSVELRLKRFDAGVKGMYSTECRARDFLDLNRKTTDSSALDQILKYDIDSLGNNNLPYSEYDLLFKALRAVQWAKVSAQTKAAIKTEMLRYIAMSADPLSDNLAPPEEIPDEDYQPIPPNRRLGALIVLERMGEDWKFEELQIILRSDLMEFYTEAQVIVLKILEKAAAEGLQERLATLIKEKIDQNDIQKYSSVLFYLWNDYGALSFNGDKTLVLKLLKSPLSYEKEAALRAFQILNRNENPHSEFSREGLEVALKSFSTDVNQGVRSQSLRILAEFWQGDLSASYLDFLLPTVWTAEGKTSLRLLSKIPRFQSDSNSTPTASPTKPTSPFANDEGLINYFIGHSSSFVEDVPVHEILGLLSDPGKKIAIQKITETIEDLIQQQLNGFSYGIYNRVFVLGQGLYFLGATLENSLALQKIHFAFETPWEAPELQLLKLYDRFDNADMPFENFVNFYASTLRSAYQRESSRKLAVALGNQIDQTRKLPISLDSRLLIEVLRSPSGLDRNLVLESMDVLDSESARSFFTEAKAQGLLNLDFVLDRKSLTPAEIEFLTQYFKNDGKSISEIQLEEKFRSKIYTAMKSWKEEAIPLAAAVSPYMEQRPASETERRTALGAVLEKLSIAQFLEGASSEEARAQLLRLYFDISPNPQREDLDFLFSQLPGKETEGLKVGQILSFLSVQSKALRTEDWIRLKQMSSKIEWNFAGMMEVEEPLSKLLDAMKSVEVPSDPNWKSDVEKLHAEVLASFQKAMSRQ